MGGHIGLRYLHDHPDMFKGAVLTAPLIDIAMPSAEKGAEGIYPWGRKMGFGKHYVPGAGNTKPEADSKTTSSPVTVCVSNE